MARPPPWIVASPVPARPTVSVLRTVRVAASTVDELVQSEAAEIDVVPADESSGGDIEYTRR